MRALSRRVLIILPCCIAACTPMPMNGGDDPDNEPDGGGDIGMVLLSDVAFWAYQIQGLENDGAVDALVSSRYDLIVLDPTRTDRENADFDAAGMVRRLHESLASDAAKTKLVVAYIDIGEAEDWRDYWMTDWVAPSESDSGNPDLLITVDPDGWSGNYPVAYWDERWKDIIIYNDDSMLQKALDDGFDGIYMDWVEGYSNDAVIAAANAAGVDPADEMYEFIREIREHARAQNPNFLVIPQNAAEIVELLGQRYLDVIDAIAQEQIYFDGDADTPWDDPNAGDKALPEFDDGSGGYSTEFYEFWLQRYLNAGKVVLSVDYAAIPENANTAYQRASAAGYVPYVSRRPLDRLSETPPPGLPDGDTEAPPDTGEMDGGDQADEIAGDLVIEGTTQSYAGRTLNVTGNVIIRNGGRLVLENVVLNIISSFEEEFVMQLLGDAALEARNSTISGQGHQTTIIIEPETDGGSRPILEFISTTVTNHAGIRPFGDWMVTPVASIVEEVQVHDRAVVRVEGGVGLYPVLFFADQDATLESLSNGEAVSTQFSTPDGWSFTIVSADVNGYQIDVEGSSMVNVVDSDGITASIHTSGNLGADEVLIEDVTTQGPDDGAIQGLGPEFIYENTAIDLFNIYVADGDRVRIRRGVVNEANTEGSSELVIQDCGLEYNLVQAYDESSIVIEVCTMAADESTQPSLTAEGTARIVVRRSDVTRLETQAIGSGRIEFESVTGLDPERLSTQDDGAIVIDGAEIR